MTAAKKCDRCGGYTDLHAADAALGISNLVLHIFDSVSHRNNTTHDRGFEYDLCANCTEVIKRVLDLWPGRPA